MVAVYQSTKLIDDHWEEEEADERRHANEPAASTLSVSATRLPNPQNNRSCRGVARLEITHSHKSASYLLTLATSYYKDYIPKEDRVAEI